MSKETKGSLHKVPQIFDEKQFDDIQNMKFYQAQKVVKTAQAIFEKFWVEYNCVMCHSKSEMKRVDSQKNDEGGA